MKKTIVLGASTKDFRYSKKAICLLDDYGHEVIAIGNKEGKIRDIKVGTEMIIEPNIDTITMYLSPTRQIEYYDYILNQIIPKRIIMNPGTENNELKTMAKEKGIEVVEHCTLIMLNRDIY
jgi:predicted CoA-binding protein